MSITLTYTVRILRNTKMLQLSLVFGISKNVLSNLLLTLYYSYSGNLRMFDGLLGVLGFRAYNQ
jgi:hypothetical protein